jgi:hypothetical protein
MQVKLEEVVSFKPGNNTTRLKEKEGFENLEFYSGDDFQSDLTSGTSVRTNEEKKMDELVVVQAGDIVINVMSQQAAVVSEASAGKVLTINFVRVDMTTEILDASYFYYYFMANEAMRRQLTIESMGTGSIRRLTVRQLKEMTIELLPYDKQVLIGGAYFDMLKVNASYHKLIDDTKKLTIAVLEEQFQGVGE